MNDQKILEQLALHPQSRAVQLADRLDVDLVDVQDSLAGLVAVGDVIASDGTSPAGMACKLYRLRKGHKLSIPSEPAVTLPTVKQAVPNVGTSMHAIPSVVVPKFLPEIATEAPASMVASPGVYRCALWSDGILEIQRDGETVAAIPKAAGISIAAFLNRLARADEGAPA